MLARSYKSTAAAVVAAITLALAAPAAGAVEPDALTDATLATCARDALGLTTNDPLTAADLATLEELYCYDGVSSLAGLENATGLVVLDVGPAVAITDLTPLAGLAGLKYLGLAQLGDVDLAPLSTLTSLEALDLDSAAVDALPDFGAMSSFQELNISGTEITDLSPLGGVLTLTVLWAEETWISDLSPLVGHDALEELAMAWAEVDDMTPLEGLASLASVDLYGNAIADASPLASLPSLAEYDLEDQVIDGGTVARCTLFETPTTTGVVGETLTATSTTSYQFGAQTLFKPGNVNTVTLSFDSGLGYSGAVAYWSPSWNSSCAWPEGFEPTVSVSGKVEVGATLTATTRVPITSASASVTTGYTWHDTETDTSVWTGQAFTLSESQRGRTFTVDAQIRVSGMTTYTATSPAVGPVLASFPAGWSPTFVNPPQVGFEPYAFLFDAYSFYVAPEIRYTYYLNGTKVATTDWSGNSSYTLPASALGKTLSVSATVRADGYATRTYAGEERKVLGTFGWMTWVYPLQGDFKVGHTVTAKHPTFKSPAPTSYTYQWMRSGKPIPGATAETYKITSADAGKRIGVVITGKRSGYVTVTHESETYKVPPPFSSAPTPVITGTPTVGNTLKAKVGIWSPSPSTLTYRWYRDGKAITGATGKSYRLTSVDAGHKITFKVTAKKSGYTTTTKTSAAVTAKRRLTTRTPSIVGTPKVGNELTAKTGGSWGPGTVSLRITWYVDGKAVGTGRSYVVKPADAFKPIKVKVTGTKSGYTTASRTTSAQTVVGKKYTSCAAMSKDYPGGVARSATTKDRVNGIAVSGIDPDTFVSAKLYDLNPARDADKDGWACEP